MGRQPENTFLKDKPDLHWKWDTDTECVVDEFAFLILGLDIIGLVKVCTLVPKFGAPIGEQRILIHIIYIICHANKKKTHFSSI